MKIRGFIISGILLAVAGISCCGVALFKNNFDFDSLRIDDNLQNVQETKNHYPNLKIKTATASISVVQGNEDYYSFDYYESDNLVVNFIESHDTLTFEQSYDWIKQLIRPIINSFYDYKNYDLKVILPRDFSGKIEISNDYGSIVLQGLNVPSIDVSINVGHIEIIDSVFDDLKAEVDVGDLILEQVVAPKIHSEVDVGEIIFDSLSAEKINLAVDVGEISGSIVGNKNDYSITYTIAGSLKEKTTCSHSDNYINAQVDVGSINITWVN